MKKLFYILFLFLINCAAPSMFVGNGILSLGTSQSLNKALISTGSDLIIKKETGKNKVEHLSSQILKKNCAHKKNIQLSCK